MIRLLAILAAATLPAQGFRPTFAAGNLGDLHAKVVDVEVIDKWARVLTIEVENRGAVTGEPLEFELTWRPAKKKDPEKSQRVARAIVPHVARYGNPTPEGSKRMYLVRTHLPFSSSKSTGRGSVSVTEASFYEGGVVTSPKFVFGKPKQVQRKSLAGAFPVTQVTLHNPLDAVVDVLVRLELTQPLNCTELMGIRLPAKASIDWLLTSRPSDSMFVENGSPPGGPVKATKFEVVDWSLIGEDDPAAGAQLLRPAYEAWYRWPGQNVVVSGEFSFREQRRHNVVELVNENSRGRFSIDSTGTPRIELTAGDGDPGLMLRMAFADFLRPDFATLAKQNRLQRLTSKRTALIGKGWDPTTGSRSVLTTSRGRSQPQIYEDLSVDGDRVTGSGRGQGRRTVWQHRKIDNRYVVSERNDGSTRTTYGHAGQGGRIMPTLVQSQTHFGSTLFRDSELVLTDLRFGGTADIEPVLPQGPGTAELRAMWDAAWALPSAPLRLEARFGVETTGTDLLWQREKKLRGKVTMQGIGRHLQRADFAFDDVRDANKELALAAAVRDRWLLWYSRDFNCRAAFDDFFRGATIGKKNAVGDFAIANCAVDRVLTKDGFVEGFRRPGGSTVRFVRKKVGDHRVVVRITEEFERWTTTTKIKWRKVGDHLLPTKIEFEKAFGGDWGPEVITFKKWKVK